MAIPKYQELMLPLLKFAADQEEHSLRSAISHLAEKFDLTEEEKKELLPSGQQALFDNRVGWAKTYLKKAGLLEYTKRGYFKITERGIIVVKDEPETIDNEYLKKFEEFIEFKSKSVNTENQDLDNDDFEEKTPKEILEDAYQTLRDELAQELLDKVKNLTPDFFEKLVIDLLINMGYGGSRIDAGKAIGKVNDGGIDGIINEDRLGLDIIYVQAKKWENVVGRPEIQKFAGALEGKRAKKGIFITTSYFSKRAKDYVSNITSKIVFIDGELLAKYMIDFDVGVFEEDVYKLKNIDNDYFFDE